MAAIEAEGLAWQYKVLRRRSGCGDKYPGRLPVHPPLSCWLVGPYCQASPSASIAAKGCSYADLCKARIIGGAKIRLSIRRSSGGSPAVAIPASAPSCAQASLRPQNPAPARELTLIVPQQTDLPPTVHIPTPQLPHPWPSLKARQDAHASRYLPARLGPAGLRRRRRQQCHANDQHHGQRYTIDKKASDIHGNHPRSSAPPGHTRRGLCASQRSSTVMISRRSAMLAGTWSSSVKNCWYHSRS